MCAHPGMQIHAQPRRKRSEEKRRPGGSRCPEQRTAQRDGDARAGGKAPRTRWMPAGLLRRSGVRERSPRPRGSAYQASLKPFISTVTRSRCPRPRVPTASSAAPRTYWSGAGRRAPSTEPPSGAAPPPPAPGARPERGREAQGRPQPHRRLPNRPAAC